ncbi:MAG: hypothetical protein RIQ57_557 [Pseudomonadota bacterium]
MIGLSAYFYLKSNMDEIVREFIVEQVSEATDTRVKLDAVKLDLKEGSGSLFNFEQPNPPGFQTQYAFHFDQAELDLDLKSILDEVIIIEKVFINGAEIVYENIDGKTNFVELKNIINANMNNKSVASSSSKTEQPQQKDKKKTHVKQSKKIIIKSFEIINTKVEGAVPFASTQTLSVTLPNIQLNNIGENEGGVEVDQLMAIFVDALENDLKRSINFNSLVRDLEKDIKRSIEKETNKIIKDLESEINDLDEIKDLKKLKDLKNLF